uniref:Ubiquitin-conjugating enzyme E2C-binding protein n=2 Tax=Kalanchoe fedtschenkoi TaxID=63787 RepID=A0A7N0TRQ1_KALFE
MSSNHKTISLAPSAPWTVTWESQSRTPILRLLIFDSRTNPKLECEDLQIRLVLEESSVLVTWVDENEAQVLLRVPLPRPVLLDAEAPLSFKAADDHIEVKLLLLLPVDHPIVLSFNEGEDSDLMKPLTMDSDLSALTSGEALSFYCRNCSTKLTSNPISCFVEMPSTDWRESADNWFGGCCCSFGGVSEKLVNGYAISYSCVTGKCLVNSTTVVICKDDLEESLVMEWESNDKKEHDMDGTFGRLHENQYGEDVSPISKHLNDKFSSLSVVDKTTKAEQTGDNTFCQLPLLNDSENSAEVQPSQEIHTNCSCSTSESCSVGEGLNDNFTPDKKFLLNGFLENIFMIRSSHVSKAVKWVEILCPKCSFLLGAYPSYASENEPLDGGMRFFKYCISSCSQPDGLMNVFRKYTLERMFTSQLLENAKDELMFRTLVRDIKSKAPALQIVMLNPNSWSYSGCCSGIANSESNIELRPVMKALFSHSSHITEFPTSQMENWVRNNDADEVYMFAEQIKELIDLLEEGKTSMPLSYTNLQGLPLSSLRR